MMADNWTGPSVHRLLFGTLLGWAAPGRGRRGDGSRQQKKQNNGAMRKSRVCVCVCVDDLDFLDRHFDGRHELPDVAGGAAAGLVERRRRSFGHRRRARNGSAGHGNRSGAAAAAGGATGGASGRLGRQQRAHHVQLVAARREEGDAAVVFVVLARFHLVPVVPRSSSRLDSI